MTDERAIRRVEELLVEVTRLGGQNERTSIVSNLVVVDPAPVGLTGFITITDERDGDTILAKTVPGIIYAVADKVNVLFVEGTEPIAFQQGSESPSSGLWGIVPSTSTDIFYNGGDVGIGKSVAPDASLEVLSAAQAQLRLTNVEDTTFVDLTLDASHDLTIKPSSTGQVIFQPTTDSVDFLQVLDADGGTPVLNVDTIDERLGVGNAAPTTTLDVTGTVTITDDILHAGDVDTKLSFTDDDVEVTAGALSMLKLTEAAQDVIALGPGSGDVDIDFNGDMFLHGANGRLTIGGQTAPTGLLDVDKDQNAVTNIRVVNNTDDTGAYVSISVGTHITSDNQGLSIQAFSDGFTDFTGIDGIALAGWARFRSDSQLNGYIFNAAGASGQLIFGTNNTERIRVIAAGDVGIGNSSPQAQLHVDQLSTITAQPVLLLDQADVSEEFIAFIGAAAAATLTQSLVDEGDVTTATRIGWFKIDVDDVGNQITDGAYFVPFYSLA